MPLRLGISGVTMVKKEVIPDSTLAAPSMEDIMKDVHGAIERAVKARSEYVINEGA